MKKVLVIDDNEILRSDLLEILTLEGYEPLGAMNGQEGLHLAQEYQPDLIICDITMPDLSGLEVITHLRQNSQTAHIPVILLSARNDDTFPQKGLQMGAAAYFPKPYDLSALLATIQEQIGH